MRTEKDCYGSDNIMFFSARNLLAFSCVLRTTKCNSKTRADNMLKMTDKISSMQLRKWTWPWS